MWLDNTLPLVSSSHRFDSGSVQTRAAALVHYGHTPVYLFTNGNFDTYVTYTLLVPCTEIKPTCLLL